MELFLLFLVSWFVSLPVQEEGLFMRSARLTLFPLTVTLLTATLSGCHFFHRGKAVGVVKPAAVLVNALPPMLPLDLTKVQPNEAGLVPILEYHDLVKSAKTKGYEYPAASFRRDMQWLYDHNYRPISLHDYVQGKIDCPAGMSPVILTFDDALRGQFNYTADGKIDPDCAVGILDDFHAKHPDWPLKGTFFVLTDVGTTLPPPFYQKQYAQGKMDYIVKEGFEIGNHTIHHKAGIRHWPDAKVQAELAGAVANIHQYEPNYLVDTLALPYGVFPKNKKLVISGASGGVSYHNLCALKAGAEPAPSPMGQPLRGDSFPYYLPRIIPGAGTFTIHYWLELMEKEKALKYVSDGDPNTYTVNTIVKSQVNLARLKNGHFHLRTYNGTQVVSST
jgi:hypothetical protein